MDPTKLTPGEIGGGNPEFVAVDVRSLDVAGYAALLGHLAGEGLPFAALPAYCTPALARLIANAEIDQAPDYISEGQFTSFIAPGDESNGSLMRRTWLKLIGRMKWAQWMLEHRPTQAEGNPAITLLTELFVELPGEDGPELSLDGRALYNYFQLIPSEDSGIKLGSITKGPLLFFLASRYEVAPSVDDKRSILRLLSVRSRRHAP